MDDNNLPTFQECLNECKKEEDKKRHLLLGNGFSIAAWKDFSYSSLKKIAENSQKSELFTKQKIKDFFKDPNEHFESFLQKIIEKKQRLEHSKLLQTKMNDLMNNVSSVNNIFTKDCSKPRLLNTLKEYLETFEKKINTLNQDQYVKCYAEIQKLLIETISKVHPETHQDFFSDDILAHSAFHFLQNFHSIHTLNYDLLLYWVIVQFSQKNQFNDGFINNQWNSQNKDQNIFYLHGALHIFQNHREDKIIKLSYSQEKGSLTTQLKEELDRLNYPIYVTEGKSENKSKTIKKNQYLKHCFKTLKHLQGTLFIIGHSLSEFDQHIFKEIFKNSKISKCFVGIFDPEKDMKNFAELKNKYKYTNIDFQEFDSKTTLIWNNKEAPQYEEHKTQKQAQKEQCLFELEEEWINVTARVFPNREPSFELLRLVGKEKVVEFPSKIAREIFPKFQEDFKKDCFKNNSQLKVLAKNIGSTKTPYYEIIDYEIGESTL